ncbi:MAG: hypothetical protein ACLQU3_05475 [Limisphaerales bacterium]
MDPRHLFVDEKFRKVCVHCGGEPDTRDHVPSKVFLDDPMPGNLPVVEACASCNQGFSFDEEYLACLVECVLHGTVGTEKLRRERVRAILNRKPQLAGLLRESRRTTEEGTVFWVPDDARVRNVILKLARGHAAYELGLPQLDDPARVIVTPLLGMSHTEREEFERAGSGELRGWPEIGNRAFFRACGAPPYEKQDGPWIPVQQDVYRYSVDQHRGVLVRIVLSEYLACEVEWG